MVTWFSTDKKPILGERVLITVGDYFVCEGFKKADGKWYRYDDIDVDVETIFNEKVTAWAWMPLSKKAWEESTPQIKALYRVLSSKEEEQYGK